MKFKKSFLGKMVLFSSLIVVIGFLLVLIGCLQGDDQTQKPDDELSINVTQMITPDATLLMIAEEKGFYEEVGLKVDKTTCIVGKLCLDSVLAHKSDVATAVALNSAVALDQTDNLRVFAVIASKNNKIIGRTDHGISSDKDLENKKFGVLHAARLDYWPRKYAKAHGINDESIEFVNLKPNEIAVAMIKGDIDAGFLWNPFSADVITELGEENLGIYSDDNLLTIFTLTTTQEYIDNHTEELTRFTKAMQKASEWYENNQDEAAKIVAENISRTNDEVKDYLKEYDYRVRLDSQLEDLLFDQYRWVSNLDSLTQEQKSKVLNIIDDQFIK